MELLNGKYKVESDSVSFTLKTGNANTYHATFKDCLLKILDNEAKGCSQAEILLKRYVELENLIKSLKNDVRDK